MQQALVGQMILQQLVLSLHPTIATFQEHSSYTQKTSSSLMMLKASTSFPALAGCTAVLQMGQLGLTAMQLLMHS